MSKKDFPLFMIIALVVALISIAAFSFRDSQTTDIPEAPITEEVPADQLPTEEGSTSRTVYLYYPNAKQNPDVDVCSPETLMPIERTISSEDPIRDTILLLIAGAITPSEQEEGFGTEFPNPGFMLENTDLTEGVLTLTFADAANFTTGGSCRVGILAAQIERTALQFEGVEEVRLAPDSLFQP